MCNCKIVSGSRVICDTCASSMIETLYGEQNELEPGLTAHEYQAMTNLVNIWLDTLQNNQPGTQTTG